MDGAPEMERDAVAPPEDKKIKQSMPNFSVDMSTLEKRLTEHFETRRSKGGHHALLPDLVAKFSIPMFFFTITSTWYMGTFEVMPALLRDYPEESRLLCHRVFMAILYLEMMFNWACIRYVDSSYEAYLKKRWLRKAKGGSSGSDSGSGSGVDDRGRTNGGGRLGVNGGSDSDAGERWNDSGVNGINTSNSKTPWKPPFKAPNQTSFPYWSWVPCYECQVMRPPRCHHCPICGTCVLKRDHHCFFAGSCVGWRNQRHFLVFGMWALLACCYASVNGIYFLVYELWPLMRWFDLFAPVTLLRWGLGYVTGITCLGIWVQSLLFYFLILSSGFVLEHIQLIFWGKTSFEVSSLKATIELRDIRLIGAKIRAVLGRWWLLNLIFPLHWVLEAQEDPENWPSVKVYRH